MSAQHPTLGLDLGTQGVRAVLLDPSGATLGHGEASLGEADRWAAGRHEQDPAGWWSAAVLAVRHALAGRDGQELAALAIASTSGTVLIQDSAGQARGPAVMYGDGRAGEQAARAQRIGAPLWNRLGYRMQPSWGLPKALWLIEHDRLRAGDRIVHQADHLAARLVGHPVATDTSHALKTGVDLPVARWPVDTFHELGIDPAVLPPVVLPGTPIGTVGAAAAAETGIPAGTVVRAGMTDGCASQIASGALRVGAWCSSLGTTLVLKGCTAALLHDPAGVLYSHRNPDGGWLPGGASNVGAGIIARDFAGADLAALTAAAARHEPGRGVTYPLTGAGERFPFSAPEATAFSTVDSDDPAARFAAVLRGVAFVERLCFETLGDLGADIDGPVTLTGGTTANEYWNQLRTDILGRPTRVPESAGAAAGMAILAAAPPGELAATAARMVRVSHEYSPDTARGQRFAQPYHEFLAALRERGWLERRPGGRVAI